MTADKLNRRYELDWLRVMAILIVFLYHSTRFFNLGDWHVKNDDTYVWVEIWNIFATRWMMPLFFVISGASLFHALDKPGGWKRFYTDKFLRLFIPVLVASLTHGALQVYLERVSHGRFSGAFFEWLPEYFTGVYSGIGLAGSGNFANIGMHLWYLSFLFVYSLLCYRLFVWLNAGGKKLLEKITDLFAMPGINLVVFIIPLMLMKALIPPMVLEVGNGGWGFVYYLWFLIAGFIIMSSDRLLKKIHGQRWFFLCQGVIFSALQLYLLFGVPAPALQGQFGDWTASMLSYLNAWCWVLGIWGTAIRHLSYDRPFLRNANEGVLPFFIMHQTVLLIVGFNIMSWEIHDVFKWSLVFLVSFIIIIAIYLALIRKFDPLRFLFGMKVAQPFYQVFHKKIFLVLLPLLWIGLSVYAGFNHKPALGQNRIPMPLTFDQKHDIVLDAISITDQSAKGVQLVDDDQASIGRAIEFISNETASIRSIPKTYIDIQFSAPAGRYFLWIRGKSDIDSEYTDSVWFQADNQIGTRKGSVHLGNWNSFHPIGIYAWASDVHLPYNLVLTHTGSHTIRIQPRQIPHRIDQIWLSQHQRRIPNTFDSIK
jgi:surface polysaccharide O-acyltransferase-like enzyme